MEEVNKDAALAIANKALVKLSKAPYHGIVNWEDYARQVMKEAAVALFEMQKALNTGLNRSASPDR